MGGWEDIEGNPSKNVFYTIKFHPPTSHSSDEGKVWKISMLRACIHFFFNIEVKVWVIQHFLSTSMRGSWKILIYAHTARSCLSLSLSYFDFVFAHIQFFCEWMLQRHASKPYDFFLLFILDILHTHMALTELKTSFIKYAFFFLLW